VAKGGYNKDLIVGLAIGLGLGLAAALLLDPNNGARRRTLLAERTRDVVNSVVSLRNGSTTWRQRQTDRAARTFMNRVERIRSAGL
jgi:gas vesicle protein